MRGEMENKTIKPKKVGVGEGPYKTWHAERDPKLTYKFTLRLTTYKRGKTTLMISMKSGRKGQDAGRVRQNF